MAIKNLKPPHYSADKPGSYIYRGDDSIDHERHARELAELGAAAEARLKADPEADISDLLPSKHPLEEWWTGVGRYDLDAVGYFMGTPVRIGDYFSKGKPTIFQLRRLSADDYLTCYAMRRRGDHELAYLRACRLGLVDIIDGGIKLVRNNDDEVAESTINALMAAEPTLPVWIGMAILLGYCGPVTDAEKKH
jgi:hypothetical protein